MAPPLDPYRTLGLAPGASADEIRRAYRRLAKANHPDSAGETALPRFLAIQAAYEMLIAGPNRIAGASRSSRADPARARATRPGYGTRSSGASSAGTGGAAGANASAGPSAGASASAGPAAGPTRDARSRSQRPGARPGSAAGSGPGSGSGSGSSDRPRSGGGRSGRNKATLGSTSYDAAEDEPFEPEWSGGTWYGASSGTYWTLNPKEYADPRKHGPEYQARARRRVDPSEHDGPDGAEDPDEEASFTGDDFHDQDSESATGARRSGFDGRWRYPDEEDARGGPEGRTAGTDTWTVWTADEPPAEPRPPLSTTATELADRILAGHVGFYGRFLVAFVGWVPIGALIAWLAGELSGCGRFTASCLDTSGIGSAIPQLVVYSLLVLAPSLAAVSAAGFVGAFAVSGAASFILSAGGGARQPDVSSTVITVLFFAGYALGAALAIARRLGWRRVP